MADYYPLLARAVAALPNSTRDTRAAIYERARKALLGQLRSLDPPVSEEHLKNESDALDSAIARLEAELAQEPAPAPSAPAPVKAAPPPRPVPPPPAQGAAPPQSQVAAPPPLSAAPPPPSSAPPIAPPGGVRPPPPPPLAHAAPATTPKPADAPKVSAPPPLPPKTVTPPSPAPQAPPPQRALETAAAAPAAPPKPAPEPETPAVIARPPTSRGEAARPAAPSRPESGRGVSRQMMIWIPLVLLIGGGIAFAAWRLRVPQEEFAKPRANVAEAARPQGAAKINERAGAPGSTPAPAPAQAPVAQAPAPQAPPAQTTQRAPSAPPAPVQQPAAAQPAPQRPAIVEQAAPVAQRSAILVQAAVNDMQNVETHVGTTVWRQEESRRPGANGSPAVRADVDIPAVGLKFVFLMEKNNDTTLRASHMLTLRFLPQEGSSLPAIAEIGSPQMRNEGSASIDPLAGVQAKITDNIYIVALNADPTLVTRNLDTLRNRGWFDFPIRLADGRIAKITVEKGAPGDRLIEQALDQWRR
jgi:hypothetical protein